MIASRDALWPVSNPLIFVLHAVAGQMPKENGLVKHICENEEDDADFLPPAVSYGSGWISVFSPSERKNADPFAWKFLEFRLR